MVSLFQGCIVIDNAYTVIPPGTWRGVLKLDRPAASPLREEADLDVQFDEVAKGELPFNFEVIYEDENTFRIEFINGEERIVSDNITYGRNRETGDDSLVINFPVFDSYITALYEEDVIEGEWVVNYKENYRIPFVAFHGKGYRFTELQKDPIADISGKWAAQFEVESDNPYPAVGEFQQNGNYLTGTFLTETGDYRFLEGTVQADKVYLSCFDGAHAFLFEGKITADERMIGSFRSGSHYKTLWEAERDPDAQLSNPDSLTYLTNGGDEFSFSFPNTEGEMVRLSDYGDQVKLVQIFGTWCPNCRDETNFLLDYLKENQNEDLAVIALGFEQYDEEAKAMAALQRFKENMNVPYEVLYAGSSDKTEASKALPMLNRIISYPTLLFVDRNNRVRRIHTGFNGPATSQYEDFKREFDASVQALLAEDNNMES